MLYQKGAGLLGHTFTEAFITFLENVRSFDMRAIRSGKIKFAELKTDKLYALYTFVVGQINKYVTPIVEHAEATAKKKSADAQVTPGDIVDLIVATPKFAHPFEEVVDGAVLISNDLKKEWVVNLWTSIKKNTGVRSYVAILTYLIRVSDGKIKSKNLNPAATQKFAKEVLPAIKKVSDQANIGE